VKFLFFTTILVSLVACTPELPNAANVTPVTAVPSLQATTLCQMAEESSNWETKLAALEDLYERNENCGSEIKLSLYVAYLGYGDSLEIMADTAGALEAYQTALAYLPNGYEARERVSRLTNLPEATESPANCDGATASLPSYQPTTGTFATLGEDSFIVDDAPYLIYGVNYYPRDTPFWHFLSETELEAVNTELALMRPTGLNTLRIFLRYQDLFACDAVVPITENFARLDGMIRIAAANDFRLIIVLHQDADVSVLYSNPPYQREQTQGIVERYKDEPAILAWDMRDRGDYDYRVTGIERVKVLTWLADTALLIRSIDQAHAITAGWWQNAADTIPLIDFVSFQFYGQYAELRQEIANLKAASNRPILLSAVGYSTFALDEIAQRNLLYQSFEEVSNNHLMGWMVYMAFEYPRSATCIEPNCPGSGNALDHYGLWNTSYFPKLAVDAIRVSTGVADE
jgi:hypothetical protein